jgi:GTP-binding protein
VRAEERLAAKKARRVPYELSTETWTEEDLPAELQEDQP